MHERNRLGGKRQFSNYKAAEVQRGGEKRCEKSVMPMGSPALENPGPKTYMGGGLGVGKRVHNFPENL